MFGRLFNISHVLVLESPAALLLKTPVASVSIYSVATATLTDLKMRLGEVLRPFLSACQDLMRHNASVSYIVRKIMPVSYIVILPRL